MLNIYVLQKHERDNFFKNHTPRFKKTIFKTTYKFPHNKYTRKSSTNTTSILRKARGVFNKIPHAFILKPTALQTKSRTIKTTIFLPTAIESQVALIESCMNHSQRHTIAH